VAREDHESPDHRSKDPGVLARVVERERAVLHELPREGSLETEQARGLALFRMGEALFRLRQLRDAAQVLADADRVIAALSAHPGALARVKSLRIGTLLSLKNYDDVPQLADQLIRFGEELQQPMYVLLGWDARAIAMNQLGRWKEATEAASALIEALPTEPSPKEFGLKRAALMTLAAAAGATGDPDKGLLLVQDALVIAVEEEDRVHLYEALRQRAELLYSAGRADEAREVYAEVIRLFRGSSEDFAEEAVGWAQGRRVGMRLRPRRRAQRHSK
jgi:tetratricopeptide (TPR) repeat protein